MLLDKGSGQTNYKCRHRDRRLEAFRYILLLQPDRGDRNGIGAVERGAHICTGVGGIQKSNQRRENILPGEEFRPELLPVGKNNINHSSHDLGYDNVGLKLFEAVHMIEQEIKQRSDDKSIPEYIGCDKVFAERNDIVKGAVYHAAPLFCYEMFRQKIGQKINRPAQQKLQMREFRVIKL